jgi:hypothetical protein
MVRIALAGFAGPPFSCISVWTVCEVEYPVYNGVMVILKCKYGWRPMPIKIIGTIRGSFRRVATMEPTQPQMGSKRTEV